MSAYVVDPRTVDYLVAWAQRRRCGATVRVPVTAKMPEALEAMAQKGMIGQWWFRLNDVPPTELGGILMRENVRSVTARYPDTGPDDMPGPVDQSGVWNYRFHSVPLDSLRAAWVVRSCDCLSYQSCETDDWKDTLAYAVIEAIREDAIGVLVGEDAPWGVTDDDLARRPVKA